MEVFCRFLLVLTAFTVAALPVSAAGRDPADVIAHSEALAFSIHGEDDEMVVRVSPARQTLAVGGIFGNIIGKSIDAVQNDRLDRELEDVFSGFEPGHRFAERITTRLEGAIDLRLERVSPMGSYAGYPNKRAAERARFERLQKRGFDSVLDLKIAYGLFGPGADLVTAIEGDLFTLSNGHKVWYQDIIVFPGTFLGTDKLRMPTSQAPRILSPRFTPEEGAIAQWVEDNGALLRERYEQAVDGAIDALLTALGVADIADGHFYLGKTAVYQEDLERAERHLRRALELDPTNVEASNALVVALGHMDRVDEAVELAQTLVESHPEYGPGWYNLAWLHAVKRDDGASGEAAYRQALALGMPGSKKIEKRIQDR